MIEIVGEICADCGRPIDFTDPSYYRKTPGDDIGKSYHSACGDPFGVKAKDTEISRLREAMQEAIDLLAERRRGNSARSPGHNARLCLQGALKPAISAADGAKP